jgi:KDO2-lipid IV(A) lauroyltransferase
MIESNPSTTSNDSRPALWARVLASLPWGVLYGLAAGVTWLARHVLRFRVAIARDNLARCFPERGPAQIEALISAHYRQLGQVIAEFLKTFGMPAEQLRPHIQPQGFEAINAEIRAGRSVITLGSHQGNWEWLLHGTTLNVEAPVDAAYKPLHGARSDRELRKQRVQYGAKLIAAKRLLREVIARRRQVGVHVVGLIADQMPTSSQSRHWLTFLGRETAFYPGPGEIARLTGYAAFFMAMRRTTRGRYTLTALPLCAAAEKLEPEIFTARYAAAVEAEIRAAPADWMWIHRRWKGQPPRNADAAPPTPVTGANPTK